MIKLCGIVGCLLLCSFDYIVASPPPLGEVPPGSGLPTGVAQCAVANNVSDADLSAYRNPDGFDPAQFDDNQNIKCYQYCFSYYGRIVDENGQFLYEERRAGYENLYFGRDIFIYIADACRYSTVPYKDPCEASYQHAVCFQNASQTYRTIGRNLV